MVAAGHKYQSLLTNKTLSPRDPRKPTQTQLLLTVPCQHRSVFKQPTEKSWIPLSFYMEFITISNTKIRLDHISAVYPPKNYIEGHSTTYSMFRVELLGGQTLSIRDSDEKKLKAEHDRLLVELAANAAG